MKRITALLLAAILLLSFSACGGKSGGETPSDETQEPAETAETSLCAMQFEPPEAYTLRERFTDQTANGEVSEINISFTLADGTEVAYGVLKDLDLESKIGSSDIEKTEVNGKTFYLVDSQNEYQAYTQHGSNAYGVQCTVPEGVDGPALRSEKIAAITFADAEAEIKPNDTDLFDVRYTVSEDLPLAGYGITVLENDAGEVVKKSVVWKYGDDLSDPDFRLMIRVFRNDTVENVTDADKTYEETTVGDIAYTVLKADEGKAAYDYFTQHGSDVYEIRNNGHYNGWSTVRDEASESAFEAFLNSIHF